MWRKGNPLTLLVGMQNLFKYEVSFIFVGLERIVQAHIFYFKIFLTIHTCIFLNISAWQILNRKLYLLRLTWIYLNLRTIYFFIEIKLPQKNASSQLFKSFMYHTKALEFCWDHLYIGFKSNPLPLSSCHCIWNHLFFIFTDHILFVHCCCLVT